MENGEPEISSGVCVSDSILATRISRKRVSAAGSEFQSDKRTARASSDLNTASISEFMLEDMRTSIFARSSNATSK